MSYVILCNPHDEKYKLFVYEEGKELYAPNYGCPLGSSGRVDDLIKHAINRHGINPDEIEVRI